MTPKLPSRYEFSKKKSLSLFLCFPLPLPLPIRTCHTQKCLNEKIHVTILFVIPPNWKHFRSPSTRICSNNLWFIHLMEYSSVIKGRLSIGTYSIAEPQAHYAEEKKPFTKEEYI